MRTETIAAITKWLDRFPHRCGTPVQSVDEITAVEKRLGIPFSDDYREFLRLFGGTDVGKRTVYGLYLPPRMQNSKTYRTENNKSFLVEDATVFYRKSGWPGVAGFYIVSTDYSGNPIGLDALGAVWISDHNQMQSEKIHAGFEDWINDDCLAVEDEDEDEDEDS